ncbi:MAG: glycosyltransferase family A protein [bacterium]
MDPKTSVIIPMYNESRYIGRCLDSLLSQSYKDFEVVLIDDGSTDHTIEIAQKYDVIILQQQHGGPGNARNR